MSSAVLSAPRAALRETGRVFALGLDVGRNVFKRPFQTREFIEQLWFIAGVSILPAALVSMAFGAVISLQLGSLVRQLGAQSQTGAASVLANVQQAAPIICALLIAGAGGTAVCADLGARTIREEIDALEVLGISPIQRLVVPRVLAMAIVAVLLNGLITIVGVGGGYFYNVILQNGTPGAYLAGFSALAQPADLVIGAVKAVFFGVAAGVVAAYRGLNPSPGPKGAATVGAGFTAQLGAMRISEEIDAVEVMAVPSLPFLVTTRVIAGFIGIIPLYAAGLLSSYVASRVSVALFYSQSLGTYDHYFNLFLPPIDILYSFLKVLFIAVLIILIHTYYGYRATGGPAGVGVAVGRSVRASLVLIFVLDIFVSLALWGSTLTVKIA